LDDNELDDGTLTIPLDRPEPYVGNGRVRVDFEWVVENLLEGLPVPTPEPYECPGAVPDGMTVELEKTPLEDGTLVTPPTEPTVDGPCPYVNVCPVPDIEPLGTIVRFVVVRLPLERVLLVCDPISIPVPLGCSG
jgi:hypothetical protein